MTESGASHASHSTAPADGAEMGESPPTPAAFGRGGAPLAAGTDMTAPAFGAVVLSASRRLGRALRAAASRLAVPKGRGRPASPQRARIRLAAFLVACLLMLALGTSSTLAVLNLLDAQAAERDALGHVHAIQALLQGGGYLQVTHLQQAQTHLQAVAGDLRRIQTNGLLGAPLTDAAGAGEIRHVLAMASDLVTAGQAGIDAAVILVPHTGDIFADLGGATTTVTPILSTQDLARISGDLTAAGQAAQLALAERAVIRDDDLRRIGLGAFVNQLHQLDALAPTLSADLVYARALVGALPALLGLSTPTRYLLLNLDSDELRPGGGFAGNYAILTLVGGHLQGGLQLHDIYTLDCPSGCPSRPVPAQFRWFDLAPRQFGLRDANLDPDFPASAPTLEALLAQEGGPPVDGVIAITPAVIEAMLQVTGPITVPEFNRTVSASDLQDVIHYYHLANGAGLSDAPSGRPYGTTDRKVFDVLLGKDLVHAVATLPPDHQRAVAGIVLHGLQTRDVQVFFNNTDAQGVLAKLGLDGAVGAPGGGDSLLVADANIGVTYANADVVERVADAVTLDAAGNATHAATLTYTYAKRDHLYDAAFTAAGGGWYYRDFVRVLVPSGAQLVSGSGCSWQPVTQARSTAWGCLFVVHAGQTATLHLSWSVPKVVLAGPSGAGGHAYQLYWQRQAGNLIAASASFTLPSGARLQLPLTPPLAAANGGQVTYAAQLSESQQLALAWTT